MVRRTGQSRRRGAILPMAAVTIVALLLFVSLSIDLGVIAIAHSQCQNAADASALAGARTLDGKTAKNNFTAAVANAKTVGQANSILRVPITSANMPTDPIMGTFAYDDVTASPTFQTFVIDTSVAQDSTTVKYTLCQSTVQTNSRNYFFASLFNLLPGVSGVGTFSTKASAIAVHRPRDIGITTDMTGSMGCAFVLNNNGYPISITDRNAAAASLNDVAANFPKWGHYSTLTPTTSDYLNTNTHDNRVSETVMGKSIMANDFWQHNSTLDNPIASTGGVPAFTFVTQANTAPKSGDTPPTGKDATAVAGATVSPATIKAVAPYGPSTTLFKGFTQAGGFWGNTFFCWPPFPPGSGNADASKDWRQRFFTPNPAIGAGVNLNFLWNSTGDLKLPSTGAGTNASPNYTINYSNILAWINDVVNTPVVFPPQLRCGRIMYYSAIPTAISSTDIDNIWSMKASGPVGGFKSWEEMKTVNFTGSITNETVLNQWFWMEYIDWCLGMCQTSKLTYAFTVAEVAGQTPGILFGGDFVYNGSNIIGNATLATNSGAGVNGNDNPKRPMLRFWFGPMTMLDYVLRNYVTTNLKTISNVPGNIHQPFHWACKKGVMAAITDIQNNHPNDFVTFAAFSNPDCVSGGSRFNRIRAPLGGVHTDPYQNMYLRAQAALWYPPFLLDKNGTFVDPFGTGAGNMSCFNTGNFVEVPCCNGATCYEYPLMLIYNQFSTNTTLVNYSSSPPGGSSNALTGAPAGESGGKGRRGATKVVILETDGAPNTEVNGVGFTTVTDTAHFFNIRQAKVGTVDNEQPSSVSQGGDSNSSCVTKINAVVDKLTSLESGGGYATKSRPVFIYTVAFDSIGFVAADLQTLANIQIKGNTQNAPATSPQAERIINQAFLDSSQGTPNRVDALQKAFTNIMSDAVSLVLIK